MARYIISDYFNGGLFDTPDRDTLIITGNGECSGDIVLGPQGGWTVKVNGTIDGHLELASVPSSQTSSKITIGRAGMVADGVSLNSAATFKNFGDIVGGTGVAIAAGGVVFTNSGHIAGDTGIAFSGDDEHVITNKGFIAASINAISSLGASVDKVTNRGTLVGDTLSMDLGGGADIVTNSGKIVGDINLGDGDDTFTNRIGRKSGTVLDTIDLGAGDDTFSGGARAETVSGGTGNDNIDLGGGNDTYQASDDDGSDAIIGGSGVDTYHWLGTVDVVINLDDEDHPGAMAKTATQVGTGNTDSIVDFENVIGGAASDTIYGSKVANSLSGSGGNDTLYGFDGNDTLDGGDEIDLLVGGQGRDILTGGAGADTFVFEDIKETGKVPANCDVITDFKFAADADKIDLSAIDADTTALDDQDFMFIGTVAFGQNAGELRYEILGDDVLIEGDVDGNGNADFAILLKNLTAVTAGDFGGVAPLP